MAGSYNHLVGTDGKFTVEYLDNLGDATEALRDCFDIIAGLKRELCEAKDAALHQAGLVADYRRDWLGAMEEIERIRSSADLQIARANHERDILGKYCKTKDAENRRLRNLMEEKDDDER